MAQVHLLRRLLAGKRSRGFELVNPHGNSFTVLLKKMPTKVNSREDLIGLLSELLDHNDAVKWENDTVYSYLQAMAAWLNDCDGYYKNADSTINPSEPSWQLFADALQAASSYE